MLKKYIWITLQNKSTRSPSLISLNDKGSFIPNKPYTHTYIDWSFPQYKRHNLKFEAKESCKVVKEVTNKGKELNLDTRKPQLQISRS